jgi:hypothetical protein
MHFDPLWNDAQFKADGLMVMLTNEYGSELGNSLVNIRSGRIEAVYKLDNVSIEYDGDVNLLVCGNLPPIELAQDEAATLADLIGKTIVMSDE